MEDERIKDINSIICKTNVSKTKQQNKSSYMRNYRQQNNMIQLIPLRYVQADAMSDTKQSES